MAADPTFPESPDQAYFRAIEEIFARHRGVPLLLSPADWKVAQGWFEAEVPFDLIDRVFAEVLGRRQERGAKGRVSSLRYFAPAVEAAWQEIRDLTAIGETLPAPALDVPARLAALGAALGRVGSETAGAPEEIAARVRALSSPGAYAETVERQLAALDAEMLERTDRAFGSGDQAAVEAEVEKSLKKLAGRLPAAEIENARDRLRRQAVRRRAGLPLLSLFSPDAEPR
ncbi:MAG TPA: hypothetical protein VGS22_23715 [Thermoanaerobaculia bacterium]|nr:hypothetical protein [Thermoanaerobaculia bacterium]